jgi:cell wall-associated NlpC family hydrolase
VSSNALRPGDLVFWATDTSDADTIHHVAIWLGNDRILEAPQSGSVVKESPMRWRGYIGAGRPTG